MRGATAFDEPGVFIAFEESPEDLRDNVAPLGFDLDDLVARGRLLVDHVRVERAEFEETGNYNLDGLFIRIAHAIDTINAKRVVLDTIETLFDGFTNTAILRAELRRLFGWLKERGVTAVITGERGEGQLTRRGLEEYVSDCVILLDQRMNRCLSTRHLRIVKYRGSAHGTNEYPFLINQGGLSILPITSLGLKHQASTEIISTGVGTLDEMLGRRGLYRGSSVLISGPAGAGKSILAGHFLVAACERGERCLMFAYEESEPQIVRNFQSVGLDLQPFIDADLLRIHSARPSSYGLEVHLVRIHEAVEAFRPDLVVVDPITDLSSLGSVVEANAMLVRLIDWLKARGTTALYTNVESLADPLQSTGVNISTLIDTWLLLRQLEDNGERSRTLFILKARGMSHSNQVREFILTDHGMSLVDPYVGVGGALTGSARLAQEARDRDEELTRSEAAARRERELVGRHGSIAAQLAALQAELGGVAADLEHLRSGDRGRKERAAGDERAMTRRRGAQAVVPTTKKPVAPHG